MTAIVVTISPPPPSPCTARKAINSPIERLRPHSADPDEKHHDRRLQHDLAAEQIAELAVKRRDDRRRQQVGGDDPRQMRQPAQFADDRRQRRRDDRLVERGQQHDQHQRRENDPDRLSGRRGADDRRRGCLIGHKVPKWLERGRYPENKTPRRRFTPPVWCRFRAVARSGGSVPQAAQIPVLVQGQPDHDEIDDCY